MSSSQVTTAVERHSEKTGLVVNMEPPSVDIVSIGWDWIRREEPLPQIDSNALFFDRPAMYFTSHAL